MSVSEEVITILSTGTPIASAAIWLRTVSLPVPRSVAPTSRLKNPSSFNFKTTAPISKSGIPDPCMAIAVPTLRILLAVICFEGNFFFQPINFLPRFIQ